MAAARPGRDRRDRQPGPGPGPGTTPPTGDRSWKFVLVAVIVLLIVFLSVPSLLSKPLRHVDRLVAVLATR